MFINNQLNRQPDLFTHFDCWFSDEDASSSENLNAYTSADPEQLGEVLANILVEWSKIHPNIVCYDAHEISNWYHCMSHEMVESIIANLLHDAGLMVYCGSTFIEAYIPSNEDTIYIERLMIQLGSADVDNQEEDILEDFQPSPDAAKAAYKYLCELLESVETLTQICDAYGPRTLSDLMYINMAILDGGYIDLLSDSMVAEVLSKMPSSETWMQYTHSDPSEN